jgi:hypothetical protein
LNKTLHKLSYSLTRKAQPPLAGASFAAKFNVEVILKLDIGTASGWLKRLDRPACVIRG